MLMKTSGWLFMLIFVAGIPKNLAATGLSELVELAKQNPEIIKIQDKLDSAKARVKKVQVLPDPMIEFGLAKKDMNVNEGSIMVQQSFPYPGKLKLMGEIEQRDVKMVEQELQDTTLRKVAETKKDYYELFFVNKNIEVVRKTQEYLKSVEEIANSMYLTGTISQADVLRVQTEISMQTEKLVMLEAKKDALVWRIMWCCLGVSTDVPKMDIDFPVEWELSGMKKYEELQNTGMNNSPMLKMVEYEIEMKEKEVELAKKEFNPDFVTSAGMMSSDTGFDNWNLKLGVMYPLYQNQKQKNAKIESEKSLLSIEKKYKQTKLDLLFMLKESCLMASSYSQNMRLYQTTIIPQAELSYSTALSGYKTSKTDFLMLLDTLVKLQDSELKYYELLKDYEKTVAEIERLTGGGI